MVPMDVLYFKTAHLQDCFASGGCEAGFKWVGATDWLDGDGEFEYQIITLERLHDKSVWVYVDIRTGSPFDSFRYASTYESKSRLVMVKEGSSEPE